MKQWYALRSKPKKETAAAALLSRAGLETYLPQVTRPGRLGRPATSEPFFPGYFFCQLDPLQGELHLASYTHGVLYIVGYGGQPSPIPDELIVSIKERLAGPSARKLLPEFRTGDRVVITGGPFRDVEAIFDSQLSAAGRARVLIQILQRFCRAEVNVRQLRLTGKAAGATGA